VGDKKRRKEKKKKTGKKIKDNKFVVTHIFIFLK